MIIGEGWVFIQNQESASSQMGLELVHLYGGISIFEKHDRLEVLGDPGRFSFCFKRNPLDKLVTRYLRQKYPPEANFTPIYKDIAQGSFTDFCLAYYKLNAPRETVNNCDFIGRYENIQEDFTKALTLAGLKQKRPLPWNDRTANKRPFLEYYTEATIEPTMRHYHNMAELGYEFPKEWTERTK